MEKQSEIQERIYPLRPSEFVGQMDFLGNIEPLVLSKKEISQLAEFEQPLFEEIKRLKEISVSTHVIYPGAFTDEKGGRVFAIIYLGREAEEGETFSEQEIIDKFLNASLTSISDESRKIANRYSSEWAKEQFAEAFKNAEGNVEEISNPERITRVVSAGKLVEKLQGLRNFKERLKTIAKEHNGEGSLDEAKRRVANLYQRYTNVLIASEYDFGRILASQAHRTEDEERAMSLLSGRLSPEHASRTLERIDHFLVGTGLKIGEDGLLETVPEELSKYVEERANEPTPEETPDYQKYNSYKVGAQQAAILGQAVLEKYELQEDKAWKVVVLERKGTLAVIKGKREIRIPKSYKRGLVDTLTVLAHEIEGHVLRHVNQEESLGDGLKLTDELTTGRSGILSEAAAMRVEDDTKQEMVGMKREALTYYYLALLKKSNGGDFRECFKVFFEAHSKRKYNLLLSEAVKNEKAFREIFDYTYGRTLRIFRRNTPLDDTSGFLPTSKQLEYIEQELVVDTLRNRGLSKLLYVAGADLYSLEDLRRLGMLNLEKVKEPEMVVAKKIWPRIKAALDEGKSLDEALKTLS